jgi:hypothetical protein
MKIEVDRNGKAIAGRLNAEDLFPVSETSPFGIGFAVDAAMGGIPLSSTIGWGWRPAQMRFHLLHDGVSRPNGLWQAKPSAEPQYHSGRGIERDAMANGYVYWLHALGGPKNSTDDYSLFGKI